MVIPVHKYAKYGVLMVSRKHISAMSTGGIELEDARLRGVDWLVEERFDKAESDILAREK